MRTEIAVKLARNFNIISLTKAKKTVILYV